MPRRFSAAEVEAALRRIGFARSRQEGSHIQLSGQWRGMRRTVTLIAREKVIPAKRMASVLRQAGVTRAEMLTLLSGEDIAD
jgi:predicted RNA binding protein YcfA (HicA-like mRNA interferase family)